MTYRPRPTKRTRRTQSEILDIKFAIYNLLAAEHPIDCIEQHVDHHQLTVLQEVERSERELLLKTAGGGVS